MTDDDAAIAALIADFYDAVSGPAGPRSVERQRRIFHPAAPLARTGVGADGKPWCTVMTPEGWVEDTAAFFATNDFHESDAGLEVERFGHIAWARSVYEARRHPGDSQLVKRGVNSIQLFHDGGRWWILHVVWTDERPDLPLPAGWVRPS
jgi:hypothetical protein